MKRSNPVLDLKKLCLNKIFWSAISASFAFTIIMFNVSMNNIDANAEEIQIIHEDIKEILKDTNYIRGVIDNGQR